MRWGAAEAALQLGGGAGASRLLGGDLPIHRELEQAIAKLKGTESALLFNSGYQANLGLLSALVADGDAVFSDELNHASIVDGCRLTRAKRHVYRHRDLEQLEELLRESQARRKLIVTESLFSMDGDAAPLRQLADLAERNGALLMVDEAHATGVFGEGAGLCRELGVASRVHIQMGTLGKALGAFGAYVAGEGRLIQFLLNRARSYVFTTALPPASCGAALAALRIVQSPEGAERRTRLAERARQLAAALKAAGLDVIGGDHQLMAVQAGTPRAAVVAGEALEQAGFLVRAVRPPTVPEGTSRLRLCVSADHTPEDVAGVAAAIAEVLGGTMAREIAGTEAGATEAGATEAGATEAGATKAGAAGRRQADLKAKDFRSVWHPFTQMQGWFEEEPLIIERAEGSTLIDVLGNRYLDGVASLWANLHGHRRPEIDAAVAEQLTRFAHSTLLGLSAAPAIELADALVQRAPAGLTRVFFSDNGSSAAEIALKMAFQYFRQSGHPERRKFLAFGEAYHGDTIGAVSAGGIDLFHDIFRQLLFEVVRAPSPAHDPDGREVRRLIAEHAHELAALVIEPLVQGAAGMLLQPRGYLKKLREACNASGILLIADEVATGFGRTGTFFAVEQEDVVPDLMCVAKGITGGYLPLAATLATEEIFNGFLGPHESRRTFFHGHTYTGNALACAAALASLRIFETDHTLEKLQPKIRQLTAWLEGLRAHPHVVEVRQCGFMAGIELVESKSPRRDYPAPTRMGHQVTREARRHGAIIRPLGDVVVLMPPLSIADQELERLLDITARAIETATASARA